MASKRNNVLGPSVRSSTASGSYSGTNVDSTRSASGNVYSPWARSSGQHTQSGATPEGARKANG